DVFAHAVDGIRIRTVTGVQTCALPISGGVTENVNVIAGNISTSGALTIADVDAGQSNFTVQASTPGSNGFGTFTLAADGTWTYRSEERRVGKEQSGGGRALRDSHTGGS